MNSAPVRIAGFVVGLAALFAVAVGVGRRSARSTSPSRPRHATDGHGDDGGHGGHEGGTPAASLPGGLAVSEKGYTLRLERSNAETGRRVPVAFTIEGPDGAPVTAYDVEHEKRLHLIAVRRDGTGFQHVHPILAGDGTWRTRLALTPGDWRVFADFNPTGGAGTTLGADLAVAGDYRPAGPPPVSTTTTVDDYTVTLDGHLEPGADARLSLSVSRDGNRSPTSSPTSAPTATWSRCARATWRTCTSTPTGPPATAPPRPDPTSCSTPRCRAPAATGCSSTSGTTVRCTRPSSPWTPTRATNEHRTHPRRRARDHGHDLRVLRQPDRAQAEQARRRDRDRQLRDREGQGHLPRRAHARRPGRHRRAGRVRRHRAAGRALWRHGRRRPKTRPASSGTG